MPNFSRRVMRDIRDRGRDLEHVLQQVKSLKQTKEILEANEKALDTTQHIQRITENLNCHSTFPVHYPGEAGLWRVLLADKKICGCDCSSGSWEHRRHRPDFAAHAGLARSRVSSHHQHPGYHLEKQQFPGSVSKRICQRPITNLLQVWIEFQHRLGFQRPRKLKPWLENQSLTTIRKYFLLLAQIWKVLTFFTGRSCWTYFLLSEA